MNKKNNRSGILEIKLNTKQKISWLGYVITGRGSKTMDNGLVVAHLDN